ncbi:MAG: hypothetical protein LBS81_04640 [Endomicrobium sp.]|jgi:hypothetical protein|nr:hypothetical protein [Endomicrobium sp.]
MSGARNHKGQSLIESMFVVIFTTVIMFSFIQICIMVVDDMIANEAAFVTMRPAVVTKFKLRSKEVELRVKNYISFFPSRFFGTSGFNPSHFVLSDKKTVEKYFKKSDFNKESDSETIVTDDNSVNPANKYASIWKGKKTIKDYPGENIALSLATYKARVLIS